VVIHVAGLWMTSPPDVIDALLFSSPTPFSAWGVIAMWAIFAAALLASVRRGCACAHRSGAAPHRACGGDRRGQRGTHALLIEGTMEILSKIALSALVIAATAKVVIDLGVWTRRRR
jgi:hypothetical protein